MSDNPYANPQVADASPKQKTTATRVVVRVLLGSFGVLLLLGLLSPMVRTARPAAYRMACSNNLKQIGLALHNYMATNGSFPPAFTVDAEGRPLHSWRTLILPYVEQQALYELIDLTKPWNDPVNQVAFKTAVPTYTCPQSGDGEYGTTYFAYVDEHRCVRFGGNTPGEAKAAIDFNGICIVELDDSKAVPWMQPIDTEREKMWSFLAGKKFPHQNGFTIALADGSVRFLPAGMEPEKFLNLTGEGRNTMLEELNDETQGDKVGHMDL